MSSTFVKWYPYYHPDTISPDRRRSCVRAGNVAAATRRLRRKELPIPGRYANSIFLDFSRGIEIGKNCRSDDTKNKALGRRSHGDKGVTVRSARYVGRRFYVDTAQADLGFYKNAVHLASNEEAVEHFYKIARGYADL